MRRGHDDAHGCLVIIVRPPFRGDDLLDTEGAGQSIVTAESDERVTVRVRGHQQVGNGVSVAQQHLVALRAHHVGGAHEVHQRGVIRHGVGERETVALPFGRVVVSIGHDGTEVGHVRVTAERDLTFDGLDDVVRQLLKHVAQQSARTLGATDITLVQGDVLVGVVGLKLTLHERQHLFLLLLAVLGHRVAVGAGLIGQTGDVAADGQAIHAGLAQQVPQSGAASVQRVRDRGDCLGRDELVHIRSVHAERRRIRHVTVHGVSPLTVERLNTLVIGVDQGTLERDHRVVGVKPRLTVVRELHNPRLVGGVIGLVDDDGLATAGSLHGFLRCRGFLALALAFSLVGDGGSDLVKRALHDLTDGVGELFRLVRRELELRDSTRQLLQEFRIHGVSILVIAAVDCGESGPRVGTTIHDADFQQFAIVDNTVLAGTLVEFNGDTETIGQTSVGGKLADTFALIYLAELGLGHHPIIGHPESGDCTRLAFDAGHVVDQERER